MYAISSWVPSWEQLVNRRQIGDVKEVWVSTEEYDHLIETREEDRKFVIVRDEIGNPNLIKLEWPIWKHYKVR